MAIRSSLVKLVIFPVMHGNTLWACRRKPWYMVYNLPGKYGMLYTLIDLQLMFSWL